MKFTYFKTWWIVVGLLVLGLAVVMFIAQPAEAQMGNTGIPVRCLKGGSPLTAGSTAFLTCIAADGTPFVDAQRVPTGYYLLVTDILITPDAGSATAGLTSVIVFDSYGDSGRQSSFSMRETTSRSAEYHWSVPYFVLVPGHRLEVLNNAVSTAGVEIRMSGLLVTNLNFLPVITR